MNDCFIRYEYRVSWLIHEIWMLGYMIVHKDMNIELHYYSRYINVGLHDYLIIICLYKIRFYFITSYIPGIMNDVMVWTWLKVDVTIFLFIGK